METNKMKTAGKLFLALLILCLCLKNDLPAAAAPETFGCYEDGDVVGFIGDSITHVTYRSSGYVEMLEQYYLSRFPERTIEFRNLGADGYKLRDVLNIYDSDPGFRGLTKAVILLGTNEAILRTAPSEYISNMEELIGRLEKDGIAASDILILSPPICDQNCKKNFDKNGHRRWTYEDRVLEYMALLENQAPKWGVSYLDIHTPMAELTAKLQAEDPANTLTTDCIHPDATGHRLITTCFLQAQGADDVLEEIYIPQEGEARILRGELTDYYRGERGIQWTLHPCVMPLFAAEEMQDFQTVFPEGRGVYGEILRIEGLHADQTYQIWIGGALAASFRGAELAEGIDLSVLQAYPRREAAENMISLSQTRHKKTAKHRNMWVNVMMQRATYTDTQIAQLYETWRAADDQLREDLYTLAENAPK